MTKTASVIKTTKGSEKKWSEVLNLNRRHDLQLPIEIAKFDSELKRTNRSHQRQKDRTERNWAHRHETWYQDDFDFRNHLLQQLKPITRRFKHIDSLRSQGNEQQDEAFTENGASLLSMETVNGTKGRSELPPLKPSKKQRTTIRHFRNYAGEDQPLSNVVLSKRHCSKAMQEYEPRLNSHQHGAFLDVAQRFLKRHPEMIEKSVDVAGKQRQQQQHVKAQIENEQERTRLAALNFGQQLDEEKSRESDSDTDGTY